MHNPTQGSGLAVCVGIINGKFAKIECLLTCHFFEGCCMVSRRLGRGSQGMPHSKVKAGGIRRLSVSFNTDLNLPWTMFCGALME